MKRFIIVTRNSVYVAIGDEAPTYVTGRASFDPGASILPTGIVYEGSIESPVAVGRGFVFEQEGMGPIHVSAVQSIVEV